MYAVNHLIKILYKNNVKTNSILAGKKHTLLASSVLTTQLVPKTINYKTIARSATGNNVVILQLLSSCQKNFYWRHVA